MKRRMIDRELWEKNSFMKMEGWAKLLHHYMYMKLCDFAGIAHLNRELAEFIMRMKLPENSQEIIKHLEPLWTHLESGYFIAKDFIHQTQGGKNKTPVLKLDNFAHSQIFGDMLERQSEGLKDVFQAVLKANPNMRIQSVKAAEDNLFRSEAEIRNSREDDRKKQARLNGLKSPRECLGNMKNCYRALGIDSMELLELECDSTGMPILALPNAAPTPHSTEL